VKYSFAQADGVLLKISGLNNIMYTMRNLFISRVNCGIAMTWHIPPSNGSPSLEVSAILPLPEIEDVFANAKGPEYDV